MSSAYLEIQTADGRRQVPIADKPVTIGRHPQNEVVISDPLSSRRHCIVEKAPNGWRVRDLNSSNGTRLNGNVIEQSRLLPGDIIGIGATKIVLVVPGGAAKSSAPSDDAETLDEADVIDESDVVEEIGEDAIVEDEDADVLGDEDVVEVEEDSPKVSYYNDDEPLKLEIAEQLEPVSPAPAAHTHDEEYEEKLQELADSLPSKPFGQYDIAMINSRGVAVHQAAAPDAKKSRQEAVEIFRTLLLIVARSRATDIHMEPKGELYQLRVRIDGSMVDVCRLPNEIGVKLTALVKILCDIDVTQKSIVQEGHFGARVPGRRIDYRVSFAPSVFGQKLVVRVQDTALAPLRIQDLNLPQWMLKEVEQTIEQDSGMVLVCGPTGSGKTTTLYALIRSSDTASKNFVTIEDPVEIQIDGVTQIPVDEAEGKSFSALLRSVLRQDPDAILVGEIRDPETARIAMQAAITGHMVFSTVHTTHTLGTIFRLLDLGVEPYLIAQGLHLVLAQRLVRQLCPYCKKPVKPTAEQLAKLPSAGAGVKQIFVPGGCPRCLQTGYSGRRAFFELFRTNDKVRDAITHSPTMQSLQEALADARFDKLAQTGYQLVADGAVAFDEIDRAVGR